MKIPLSNRLLACCGYVNPGDRVADVGCDHGYLGIYLLKTALPARSLPLTSGKCPCKAPSVTRKNSA